jgi:hypothetical protein
MRSSSAIASRRVGGQDRHRLFLGNLRAVHVGAAGELRFGRARRAGVLPGDAGRQARAKIGCPATTTTTFPLSRIRFAPSEDCGGTLPEGPVTSEDRVTIPGASGRRALRSGGAAATGPGPFWILTLLVLVVEAEYPVPSG